jgi:hypothetical protein
MRAKFKILSQRLTTLRVRLFERSGLVVIEITKHVGKVVYTILIVLPKVVLVAEFISRYKKEARLTSTTLARALNTDPGIQDLILQ